MSLMMMHSVDLQDGIWDLLFGRVTFVGLLYSFAIQGQEIARTATRIVLTATFSMGATALLLFMKFEHTKSCYQNGMHVDLSARADGKELEFSRTMFMRVWLPKFESEQSFSQMATDHADEMELHAYAMFEALQYEVNSVWADQAGKVVAVFFVRRPAHHRLCFTPQVSKLVCPPLQSYPVQPYFSSIHVTTILHLSPSPANPKNSSVSWQDHNQQSLCQCQHLQTHQPS